MSIIINSFRVFVIDNISCVYVGTHDMYCTSNFGFFYTNIHPENTMYWYAAHTFN